MNKLLVCVNPGQKLNINNASIFLLGLDQMNQTIALNCAAAHEELKELNLPAMHQICREQRNTELCSLLLPSTHS